MPWRPLGALAFLTSGAAGLIFEVCLQRQLVRLLGVSGWSTAIVLATYMTGLLLGSALLGPWADSLKRPLRAYACLELGIGAWALAVPSLIAVATRVVVKIFAGSAPEAPALLVGRAVAALAITLLPTFLMGATLPTFARGLAALSATRVTRLYQLNLLGAAAGAALCTWVLLPGLGLAGAFSVGAALNLLAAAFAFRIDSAGAAPAAAIAVSPPSVVPRALAWVALLSGLVTFAAEVTWTHLLASVVGNSSYAFGLMLTVFLVGLMLGSAWMTRASERPLTVEALGKLQLAAAAGIAFTIPLWDKASNLFLFAGPVVTSFAGREVVRAVVCIELMLIPAALLGTIFPLVLRVATQSAISARTVGRLAAWNTLGAVIGALVVSFVLMPRLGSQRLLVGLVLICAGAALIWLRGKWRAAAVAIAVFALVLPAWDIRRIASGTNVYFSDQGHRTENLLWWHESIVSGITSVMERPEPLQRTLLTNGKFQGNDTGEISAQRALAQLPMLVGHDFHRALVIGIGTGCSLSVLAAQPFEHVDAVDLAGDIITAARGYFSKINQGAFDNPRVAVHETDGRNFLMMSSERYDVVSLEISSVWFAGAADLYNRQFTRLVADHLAPHGVLQQWVQLHHLSRSNLAVVLQSIRAELPHLALFLIGRQGIILAAKDPLALDYEQLVALSTRLRGTGASAGLPAGDLLALSGTILLDEAGVDALIRQEAERAGRPPEEFLSTDENLWLEYSTPRGNADPTLASEREMVASLAQFVPRALPVVGASAPEALVHLQAAQHFGAGDLESARALLEAGPLNEAGRSLAEALARGPKPQP